jgi:hypothetical protein
MKDETMNEKKWIPMTECIEKGIYLVDARNFSVGIWLPSAMLKTREFYFSGIRHKWGSTFIDQEEHWDCGEPYGTAKPYKLLEMYSDVIGDDQMMNCLKFMEIKHRREIRRMNK